VPGIGAAAAYIPRYRLPRELIAKEWGGVSAGGEKAVANHDEDSLTLALGAALGLTGEGASVDAVFFATTFTLAYLASHRTRTDAGVMDTVKEQPAAPAPAAPASGTAPAETSKTPAGPDSKANEVPK